MIHPYWRWQGVFLLLCAMHLLMTNVYAADKMLDASRINAEPVSLTPYFEVLEDASQGLTLADVQKPDVAAQFKPSASTGGSLSLGYTRSAYWFRLTLQNSSAQPLERMLEISHARLSLVQFHLPDADGVYQSLTTGMTEPFATRPYKNRNFVFPVNLPAKTDAVFYLRLQSTSPLFIPAQLWEPKAFHAYERNDYVAQAWYFGLASAMIIFNLLLFVALRDRIYLLYISFVSCGVLSLAAQNGLTKEFIWLDSPLWSDISTYVGFSVTLALMVLFVRRMLDTPKVTPRFDGFLKVMVGVLLVFPLGLALSYQTFAKPAALLFGAVALLALGTGVFCAFKRQRSAYFFLAAFVMLIFGSVMAVMRGLGLLPTNALTVNGLQLGSAAEMLLLALALADRFNMIRREKARAQREALEAQTQLVENLQSSERVLEERVAQRTAELQTSNKALNSTLHDLQATQSQLIQSEKMASLGQLVASVAHEINTPIGAIKSSGKNIADALEQALQNMPRLFQILDQQPRLLFLKLIAHSRQPGAVLSTREERAVVAETSRRLTEAGIEHARSKAGVLVQLNAHLALFDYLPLLCHPECDFILDTASSIASIINSTGNINTAVDRVAKIVFALKSFSRMGNSGAMMEAPLQEGMETVLTIYQSQIRQGIELVRHFEEIAPLRCLPDELGQVWTNLIHNALQAMNHTGTLTIGIRRVGDEAVVSVGDTGCGIPESIRGKIFDAFFTTKPVGEGSGLGLDIVKKIIDKHRGRIKVQSEVGVGTTFSVYLPYGLSPQSVES